MLYLGIYCTENFNIILKDGHYGWASKTILQSGKLYN
jgi:hypothetical protein